MKNFEEALHAAPRLRALYHLLNEVEQENPALMLVADTPFFVHKDGTPYDGNIINPRYVPSHTFDHRAVLKRELELIAAIIEKGEYPKEDVAKFEDWAVPQMSNIRRARRVTDLKKARRLKRQNRLN